MLRLYSSIRFNNKSKESKHNPRESEPEPKPKPRRRSSWDSILGSLAGRLPVDIVLEILLRVPAQDLNRFKRVCKSWCALFSHAKFADAHLSRAQPTTIFTTSHGDLLTYNHCYILDPKNLQEEEQGYYGGDGTIRVKQLRLPLPWPSQLMLINSCRGLLLLLQIGVCSYQLVVCNPVTGWSKTLETPVNVRTHTWSLVYDSFIEKFKVFGIGHKPKGAGVAKIQGITLGMDETCGWRELDLRSDYYFWVFLKRTLVTTQHHLHWLANTEGNPYFTQFTVYSLDVANESISSTKVALNVTIRSPKLTQVGGFLCLMSKLRYCLENFQVWVLVDSVSCTWTQIFEAGVSFPYPYAHPYGCFSSADSTIFASRTSSDNINDLLKILHLEGGSLFLYDLNTRARKGIALWSGNSLSTLGEAYQSHFHSLVSCDG